MGLPLRDNSFCEFSHTRSTYNLLELSTHNFILIILVLESVHTLSKNMLRRASAIQGWICRCAPGRIMDIDPVAFPTPVKNPASVANGKVDTTA